MRRLAASLLLLLILGVSVSAGVKLEQLDDVDALEELDGLDGEIGGLTQDSASEAAAGVHHYNHNGVELFYHVFRGYRVVEPQLGVVMGEDTVLHRHHHRYRVSLEMVIKNDYELPHSTSISWMNFPVKSITSRFVQRVACGNLCRGVKSAVTKRGGQFWLNFYCHSKKVCSRVRRYFSINSPQSQRLFGFLEFTLVGIIHEHQFVFHWRSGEAGEKPVEAFHFEDGKALLYTIKSNIGQTVYATYTTKGQRVIPSKKSLPKLYRSDQLDSLSSNIGDYKLIVAEMRKHGRVVAQLVFDVSTNKKTLNLMNWFSPTRLVSSFPYEIGKTGFNYFSMAGHKALKRTFFVNYVYRGCPGDTGFWMIADKKDVCSWAKKGWKGSAPELVYSQVSGIKYSQGNAFYADRFLVYLTNETPKPRPVPYPFFRFEGDKALLYTIKSNIGQTAYKTFKKKGTTMIPSDGKLPNLYRSKLLDTLPFAVKRSGYGKIVAEMRTGSKVVAQVVFDVSTNTKKLNFQNWFTRTRMVSSFPYELKKTGFNFFSFAGHQAHKRTFFINNRYRGCGGDVGFWVVSDRKDVCSWDNKGWHGSAPVLVYTQVPNKRYSEGNAFFADRFIVYLTSKVPELHPELPPVFRFEGNKNLLYTIKSNIGEKVYTTFKNRGNNEIPSDRSLPKLYRSDQLDTLANAVERSGFKHIVAEMRAGSRVVAQVVFDVSINTKSLNFQNWFTPARMVSSFPYKLKKTGFNYFSFAGHQAHKRTFFISNRYRGCGGDIGFWVISDRKDVCKWSNKGWHSSGPVLVYTQVPGVPFAKSNAYYADRFIVYMAHIGKTAYSTFRSRAYDRIPKHRSLPDLYRSNQLDTLPSLIHRTGYKRMVAEMRTDGKVVAQVVFDVSRNPKSLNMVNWFSKSRLVSSYPYQLGKSGYNYFSVAGHQAHKRTFFINSVYAGCAGDIGFWMAGPMQVGYKGWHGSAPALIYTRLPGKKYSQGNAFYADRFLVYLANEVPKPAAPKIPLFHFEGHRALLYTVKSGAGHEVFKTFRTKGPSDIPADRSLPDLYRSDQLDALAWTLLHTGYKRIVAEMRSDGRRVAQVVFDVSRHTKSVGMTNWFTPTRLVSSYPYHLGKTGYNYFSVAGHRAHKRTFFINKVYAGCAGDLGFWMVSDRRDPCKWANKGWSGSAPVLVYTKKPGKYSRGNAFFADRFLVYLE
uniref:Peptidase_S9 domain-containing protein n=1 Tax=Macrostomum lignano TaxID=282301 RepID=A0A1I8GLC5_9PLAT